MSTDLLESKKEQYHAILADAAYSLPYSDKLSGITTSKKNLEKFLHQKILEYRQFKDELSRLEIIKTTKDYAIMPSQDKKVVAAALAESVAKIIPDKYRKKWNGIWRPDQLPYFYNFPKFYF